MTSSTPLYRRNSFPFSPILKFHRSPPPPPHSPYKLPTKESEKDINENPFAYFITPPSPEALPSPTTEQLQMPHQPSPPTPFLSSSPWSFADSDESDDYDDDDEEDLTAGIEMAPLIRNTTGGYSSVLPAAEISAIQDHDSTKNEIRVENGDRKGKGKEREQARARAGAKYTDFILFDAPSPSSSSSLSPSPLSNAVIARTQQQQPQQVLTKPRQRRMAGSSSAPRRWRRSWAAPDWRLGVIFESSDEEDDEED